MLRYKISIALIKVGTWFLEWGFKIAGNGSAEIHCCPDMDRDVPLVLPFVAGFGVLAALSILLQLI